MNTHKPFRHEREDRTFATPFDPVLSGVAQGLARLFPPIETVGVNEHDGSMVQIGEPDSEQPDE